MVRKLASGTPVVLLLLAICCSRSLGWYDLVVALLFPASHVVSILKRFA
jgi:hypothetical protein